jgi:tetratricopeptide (TPR) repeat protein
MTTRPFTVRWARQIAPVFVLLLPAACNQQTDSPQPVVETEAASELPPNELQAGDDQELKPLAAAGNEATLPVAYPAGELPVPIRIARPFPLGDPQLPLPRIAPPRSVVRDVRPLPDEPAAPQSDAVAAVPETANTVAAPVVTEAPSVSTARETAEIQPEIAPAIEQAPPVVAIEDETLQTPAPGPPTRLPATFASQQSQHTPRDQVRRASARTASMPRAAAEQSPITKPDAMQAVTRQAQQMIRHGYHLAERGALYSARADFIRALRTIAQALDVRSGLREHTQALAAGLTALEEAEDFVPEGSRLESDLDVGMLVQAHRTPACKTMDTDALLPVTALQHYYTYAQEQLALSAGGEESASMALLGLGKTYSTLALEKSLPTAVAEPKAMVFHWAALSAHPGNFLAANELAVLEARWGQYTTARSLLQYSLAILPHSAVWRNLATVHKQLGEAKLAELAMQEAEIAAKREAAAKPGNSAGIVPSTDVEWLDSKSFAATSRSEVDVQKPTAGNDNTPGVKATPVVAPAPARQRSAASWLPWLR